MRVRLTRAQKVAGYVPVRVLLAREYMRALGKAVAIVHRTSLDQASDDLAMFGQSIVHVTDADSEACAALAQKYLPRLP